ncbi:hypothetical protein DTO012A7_8110 [Penicillium roqueforti]|nr:hypothetical protein LCP963914a_6156 [Penicillium roqueforti]KAI3223686.1 hypothetical protein DTO012A7_8110 [Penicillium roqueforti]
MEVVLPNGELLRTGMGAMKDNKTFALYKGGFGLTLDGVVTKIGMYITPAPEVYATLEVSVPKEADLIPFTGTLLDLMRRSIILNLPSIANIFRIALISKVPEVYAKLALYMEPNLYVPYSVLEEIRVKIEWREFPGSLGCAITVAEIKEEEIPYSGILTLTLLGIVDSRAEKGGVYVDFSPIIPLSGLGIELVIYTSREEARVLELCRNLLYDGAEQGYMEYRTHVRYMDQIAAKLDFNGFAFNKFTGRLKDVLDPNGVLSPGKSGIWNEGVL